MKILRLLFFLVLILLSQSLYSQELKKGNLIEGDFFYAKLFKVEIDSLKIGINDKGEITGFQTKLKLDYEEGFHTRLIHYLVSSNSILICAEVTDDEVSYNEILCIDKYSRKKKWNTQLRNFNLTVGLAENEFLYIGTINSVYKLNFDNGERIWETEGFYNKYKINSFISIKSQDETIELKGVTRQREMHDSLKTVLLDKKSGKLIGIK